MSKNKELSEDEFQIYKINRSILKLIEEYKTSKNIANDQINILDFGCGRGRSVLKLKIEGYNIFGVDVDSLPINNAKKLYEHYGFNVKQLLSEIDVNNRTLFPDNYFDIVFSIQVVEHIQHIETFLNEIARITKPSGINYHIFPFKYHYKEQHLGMPLIHWLPKNKLRKNLIQLMVLFGVEPFWEEFNGINKNLRALKYYQYSCLKTFYRSNGYFRNKLDELGYDIEIINRRFGLKLLNINTYFPHSTELVLIKH